MLYWGCRDTFAGQLGGMVLLKEPVYRIKNAAIRFFCPLCGNDRGLQHRSSLGLQNYAHILLMGLILNVILWPFMGPKALFAGLLIWPIYEWIHKAIYRQDLPCPHCGFDAAWYKRDVQMARKIVQEFWQKKNPPQQDEK